MARQLAWCLLCAAACSEAPPPASEVIQEVSGTCSLLEFGAPCDPGGGGGADECDGICWQDGTGVAVCRRLSTLGLPANYLDGRLCGSPTSSNCGDSGHICSAGSCSDFNGGGQPLPEGRACRPTLASDRCAGMCNGLGECVALTDACPYGRGVPGADTSCWFDTCGGFVADCLSELMTAGC